MARTPSTMLLQLGSSPRPFELPDADGAAHSLDETADAKALLVMFICNHCPFVLHIAHELAAIGREYAEKGLAVVAINSNDVEKYPDDSPEKMKEFAREYGFTFPYLFDESQDVAKRYCAACTPDFYLYGGDRKLVYRGQLDGSRPGNDVSVTGEDLRGAIDRALAGEPPVSEQMPSIGCNIKWKAGNDPDYLTQTA